jgi:hypothetical protein
MAVSLSSHAVDVGLLIWWYVGVKRDKQPVRLSIRKADLGISVKAVRRGISALEQAGLIHVERQSGKALRVALLPVPETLVENDHG